MTPLAGAQHYCVQGKHLIAHGKRWKVLPIPRWGGKEGVVCEDCVPSLEAQERLDVGDVADDQGHEFARRTERGEA